MDKSKFLVSAKPFPRDVTFSDGTVEKLHFKQVDAGRVRQWRQAEESNDEAIRNYAMQRLIGQSLCDPDGNLALTEEEAHGLTAQGLTDLFPHVMAVIGLGSVEKKALPSAGARNTSAASSASRSGKASKR